MYSKGRQVAPNRRSMRSNRIESSCEFLVTVMMQRNIEQRYAIKFCVKLGKSGSETVEMLKKAFGDEVLSQSQVYKWYQAFKNGRQSVEDEPRDGRPSTSTTDDHIAGVRDVLNSDRRLSVRLIAETVGLPKTNVYRIITEQLQMRKICAKLVPKVLTPDNKDIRLAISHEMLDRVRSDQRFLRRVITGDESWVFQYDPQTKRQSSEWHTKNSPRPKKARMSKSRVKTLLLVFFIVKGWFTRNLPHLGRQ